MSIRVPDEMFVQSVLPGAGQPGSRPEELRPFNIQASPADFGAQVGQAVHGVGTQAEKAGDMLAETALRRQATLNEANVNDVYLHQFVPQQIALEREFRGLQGKEASDRFDEYMGRMNDLVSQTKANLPNDFQRKAFDVQATRRVIYDLEGMSRHADQQLRSHDWNNHNAVIDNLVSEGADNWNNPGRLKDVLERIDREHFDFGAKYRWSRPVIESEMLKGSSKLWQAVIERQAIQGDVTGAMQAYHEAAQRGEISGQVQTRIDGFLRPYQENLNAQRAFGIATGGPVASQIASEAQRQGVDPRVALTVWSCEGAVLSPETKNPRSSATGHFQLLDSTWADTGGMPEERLNSQRQIELGIKSIKQNSDRLQRYLGRQPQPWEVYLAHQQGIKGAEAMLANPGANAASLVGKEAVTLNGGNADMTAWQFMSMVRGYVDRHSQMFDDSGLPTAQNLQGNYIQGLEAVRRQAQTDYPNDPAMQDRYVSYYENHAAIVLRADRLADRQDWAALNGKLHGPDRPRVWDDVNKDPQFMAAYARLFAKDPTTWTQVDTSLRRNASDVWSPAPSPETEDLYRRLKGMQITDRGGFENTNLNLYYGRMPISQFNQLVDEQNRLRAHERTMEEKNISDQRVARAVERVLNEAPFAESRRFTASKEPHGETAAKYYRLIGDVALQVGAWRQNNNERIPDDRTIEQIARAIILQGQTARAGAQQAPDRRGETGIANAGEALAERSANRDTLSLWIADLLQRSGKAVTDDSISAVQDALMAQDPRWEKDFRSGSF